VVQVSRCCVSATLALNSVEESDRRTGARHISILRVGRVVWDDRDQLCVIRNISPGGLMFEAPHAPQVGQHLSIELRSDKRMTGLVRWVTEGHAGIAFDQPIDVEQVLREDRSSLLRVRPRAPRFVRRGSVRLLGEGEPVLAAISDISIGGVRCRPDLPVRRGEPIVAVIEGVGATNAEVRWQKGDVVGVRFEKPLPWRAFQLWLDQAPRGD
jgi:hypothetical protein